MPAFFSYLTFYTTTLVSPFGQTTEVGSPASYVASVYIFLVTVVGVVSLTGVVYGAVMYSSSAGNAGRRSLGLKRMIESIIGLILLVSATLILKTINPELIGLENPNIPDAQNCINDPNTGDEVCTPYAPGPYTPPPPSGPPPSTVPAPIP